MRWLRIPPQDLLRDRLYRRLWTSILISAFGGQITMLAIPLTAAVLLKATPTQMGLLTAMEIAPFALFSLPAGVWLDRVRKLPVYIAGEFVIALMVGSIPLVWALGWLRIEVLYVVGFVLGCVFVVAGTAAQIVLTQVVPRERLVEAHAKNALANSFAEVTGPGAAGALIRAVGAPLALVVDAVLVLGSVLILRGLAVEEHPNSRVKGRFWPSLREGLRFVARNPLLVALAVTVGLWQLCHHAAMVVQILYATRELGLNERDIGLCYVGMGVGSIVTGMLGPRLAARLGTGPCLLLGIGLCGLGWLQLALVPAGPWGIAAFVLMLMCFAAGASLLFVNFLSLRQAATPAPLLGRMTSTMRWLILLPAAPGALLGGWLGEHLGLRWALGAGGAGALLLALLAWRLSRIAQQHALPPTADHP